MKISIGHGLGLVAAFFLSACEAIQKEPPVVGEREWEREFPRDSMDVTRQQLLVGVEGLPEPLNVNFVLADQDLLFRALQTQFPSFRGPDTLREFIDNIDIRLKEGVPDEPEFQGYAGALNRAFFDAARMTLQDFGADSGKVNVRLVVHGQIIHYLFDRPSGYGEIHSITYFTKIVTPDTPDEYKGPNISTTDAVRFEVTVRKDPGIGADGFVVVDRDDRAPDGPFPGTMPFTPEMTKDVEFYGYQHKLWAKGNSIHIDNIATKYDGEVVFTDLPRRHPHYRVRPDSCFDMLFVKEPPADLGGLGPPFYCLGRCEHPGLVNTNAP